MGTAAVLAVYAAGYVRTQSAAGLFDEPMPRRRPVEPAPIQDVLPAIDLEPAAADTPDTPADAPLENVATAVTVEPSPAPVSPAPAAPARAKPNGSTAELAPPLAAIVAPAETTEPVGVPAATAASADAPPDPTAAPAPVAAAAVVPAAEPTAPAAPAAPTYKDGSYTGWGTSRHGDIEATVVIENGRIASAVISKCWTRYPCSWIVALPPQVAQRQSPEVDYVSGATQSTNAFYYAVVEALSKAR
jgi:uncharacterized protein with FMN-binding domain